MATHIKLYLIFISYLVKLLSMPLCKKSRLILHYLHENVNEF